MVGSMSARLMGHLVGWLTTLAPTDVNLALPSHRDEVSEHNQHMLKEILAGFVHHGLGSDFGRQVVVMLEAAIVVGTRSNSGPLLQNMGALSDTRVTQLNR